MGKIIGTVLILAGLGVAGWLIYKQIKPAFPVEPAPDTGA